VKPSLNRQFSGYFGCFDRYRLAPNFDVVVVVEADPKGKTCRSVASSPPSCFVFDVFQVESELLAVYRILPSLAEDNRNV
jgi:hypothetical protein